MKRAAHDPREERRSGLSPHRSIPVLEYSTRVDVHWHVNADAFAALAEGAEVRNFATADGSPFRVAHIEVDGQPVTIYSDAGHKQSVTAVIS